MNLGREEGGSSQTSKVSLEGARSLALIPMASLGPSVLHKVGEEGCTASGMTRRAGKREPWREKSQGLKALCHLVFRSQLLREASGPGLL